MIGQKLNNQKGAAAIFVVAFFTILIGVIAVSFVNIVVQDQKQALNNDLSQSAYDSTSGGVEDAMRALKWYGKSCINLPRAVGIDADCRTIEKGGRCNLQNLTNQASILPGTKYDPVTHEVKISQSADTSDEALDQAYSCVSLQTVTKDYIRTLEDGKSSTIVPLKTVGNQPFTTVELNWYTVGSGKDAAKGSVALSNTADSDHASLPQSNADSRPGTKWGATTPPIMRVELIPVLRGVGAIDILNMDSDTRTLFLYPSSSSAAPTTVNVTSADSRGNAKTLPPQPVKCDAAADDGQYACSVKLSTLKFASGDSAGVSTDFFVRLTSLYNNATTQIKLYNSTGALQYFDNVSPTIDSTGRAADVYRQVQVRVTTEAGKTPTTDGGFDVTEGLCKDFQVPQFQSLCPTSAPRLDRE